MFLKNWLSSVGVAVAFGVGEGLGDIVCAPTPVAIKKRLAERTMPKRHCDTLLLLMSVLLVITASNEIYLLTTSTTNEPGFTLRCGRPPGVVAGVSRYSAADRKTF